MAFAQEIAHRESNFLNVGFEGEMSSIQKLDSGVRVIALGRLLLLQE